MNLGYLLLYFLIPVVVVLLFACWQYVVEANTGKSHIFYVSSGGEIKLYDIRADELTVLIAVCIIWPFTFTLVGVYFVGLQTFKGVWYVCKLAMHKFFIKDKTH